MKAYLNRILFLLALCCVFLPLSAEAQKPKRNNLNTENKIVSTNKSKTENKTETKTSDPKPALSALEIAIVEELNQARNEPQKYLVYLEEYKKYMQGNVLALPNKQKLIMIEGLPAIDDALIDLRQRSKINSYEISGGLSKVARQQLADLQENPKLKHLGKDGSDLEMRLLKIGFPGSAIAENISYRADIAREVILNMIIDDGIKSRSHRKNIFSQSFKLFGIACGLASDKTTLCVAEFADSFKER